MLRRAPFLGRLAKRYALRHKGQTLRAVAGLLVATTVLMAGLGMGESIAGSIEKEALARFGPIDVTMADFRTFDTRLVASILADPRVAAEGVTGAGTLSVTGSAAHPAKGLAEAFATIRGVSAAEREALGAFTSEDGAPVPEPGAGETVLSASLARSLDARVGDTLRLRAPPPGATEDLDVDVTPLVGVGGVPNSAGTTHTLTVRRDAIGLGAQIEWTADAGGDVVLEALAPDGFRYANASATSPLQLVIPPPLLEGEWTLRVNAPRPLFYQGAAGIAYLPADLVGGAATLEVRVIGIAADEGRAAITGRPAALVDLGTLQRALGTGGNVTHAYYHVTGDPYRAVSAIESALGERADDVNVRADKAELIADATESGAQLTGFLLVMGAFTLLAAILLAFTLFSALVEERRAELGIMRALGLTRGEVALAMTLEGALYAAFAAIVGLALGLLILWGLLTGIDTFAQREGGPRFALDVSPTTIAIAFAVGTLLPLATIGFASLRFARLDPARAIRGIPDDPKTKRRTGLLLGGALVLLGGLLSTTATGRLAGLPLIAAGIAAGAWSAQRPRLAALSGALGVAHLAWSLYTFTEFPESNDELDPILSLGRGAILALGLAAFAVASARPYERIAHALGGMRAKRSIFLALKYIVARRRPAGLTMAMIALVVVIVTVMGTLFSVFSQTIPEAEAGYTVLGESPLRIEAFPRPLPDDLARAIERAEFLPSHIELNQAQVERDGEPLAIQAGMRQFLGVTPGFAESNEYALSPRAEAYATDREAWQAVQRGEAILMPQWALDRNAVEVGDVLTITLSTLGTRDYIVAGGVDSDFVFQTFFSADHVRAMGFPTATQVFVRLQENADTGHAARRLTSEYAEDGLSFTSIPEEIARVTQAIQALVLVFESFLALGLFVGLAATGFLAARAVHERMRDIGTLRALGYEETDVRGAFILESTLTAGIGLLIGTLTGLLVAHSIWWREIRGDGIPFRPPWLILVAFAVVVLALAAAASNGPAKRAARLAPAIAVRHVE